MRNLSRVPRVALPLVLAGVLSSMLVAGAASAEAATCSNVDIAFARGTGEGAGLGITGTPFVRSLTSDLAGQSVSSYAVNYAAAADQSSAGPGGTDMTNHIVSVAASCPGTKFVIGGYSQGASVTDVAVGIDSGGTAIPASLASRVVAVVVFGNPLGLRGRTIATASAVYGPKSKDFCNDGDPVCGGGSNIAAHLAYASNGATTQGAAFAASLVQASPVTTPPVTTPPVTTPPVTTPPVTTPPVTTPPVTTPPVTTPPVTTPPVTTPPVTTPPVTTPPVTTPPVTTPPVTPATCVSATPKAQVAAGRATSFFGLAWAKGSHNFLGRVSSSTPVSLKQTSASTWTKVSSC